jgi:type II secretory pathway component PulL
VLGTKLFSGEQEQSKDLVDWHFAVVSKLEREREREQERHVKVG